MGNLEMRIQQLEGLYQASPGGLSDPEEREKRRAVVAHMLQGGRAKAEREEAAGDPRRRIALDRLEEAFRRRSEGTEP